MSEEIKTEILSSFKEMQTVFFATSDDERPYVRPMLLLYVDNRFWIATGSKDTKTSQLKKNPKCEFCLLLQTETGNGSIRGSGKVEFIQDMEIRKEFIDNFSYIHHYWQTPDDPDYILLELKIQSFEYMRPGADGTEKIFL